MPHEFLPKAAPIIPSKTILPPDSAPANALPVPITDSFQSPPLTLPTPLHSAEMEAAQTASNTQNTTAGMDIAQRGGADLEPLVRRFQRASRRHRQRVRWAIRLGVGSALVLMAVNVAALIALLQTEHYPFAEMWGLWLLNTFVFALCVVSPLRSAQERRAIAVRLADYEDVRVVGPLTELLTSSDKALRKTVRIGLIRLLPRMTPLDAYWLTTEQLEQLGHVLEQPQMQPELSEAVLRAFAQVGDSRALPQVRRVAEMRAHTSRHKALRALARECLPLLCVRVQHEAARQTLLRARDTGLSDPTTLLRVPTGENLSSPGNLLRPAE
jgi:hypothetical protein